MKIRKFFRRLYAALRPHRNRKSFHIEWESWVPERMEALIADCGLKDEKDLINHALSLFEFAVKRRKEGHIIASVNKAAGTYAEIKMPALDTLSSQQ